GGGSAPFLQQLANQGGGRFYAAANPAAIPDIFLKETQQVAGQQIVEERFHPIQTGSSPILRGLDSGFPALLGYNGTTIKSAAQTVLVTARDDPLLAQWQYGLGRSVAWTSDSTGRWAKDWVGWTGFGRFFSQLVGWTFPGEETGGIEARFDTIGERTTLHVESVAADGSPRDFYLTSARIVGPDLATVPANLVQVAPGVYEAPLGTLDPGAYAIRLTQTKPGAEPLGRTVGLVAPTSAEYRLLGTNEAFLGSLRAATGGRQVAAPPDVWTHDLRATNRFTDLWPFLLIVALLLWPLDIGLRRVSVGRRELVAARAWLRGGWRQRRPAERTAEATAMLAARDRAGSSAARAAMLRTDRVEANPAARPATAAVLPVAPLGPPAASPPAGVPERAAPPAPPAPAPTSTPGAEDTISRLREAKRRARER
ncbi:MAG: glutamine amidotransferase, partial [Candidatus Limnocylindrales bacterium]